MFGEVLMSQCQLGNGIPEEHVKLVEAFFLANEEAHLREANRVLGFSITNIWVILRRILKWRAYTPFVSACLSQSNVEKRL